MNLKRPFQIGDAVCCRCLDSVTALPLGLPENALAKVIATYIGLIYVSFDGKSFIVPDACVHHANESGTPTV